MPSGVAITFLYDGDPIDSVIYARTHLVSQMNATPSPGEVWVRDTERTHEFNTGHEVQCLIDGTPIWGGYIVSTSRVHLFPDTVAPAWRLAVMDYNLIFDKRVVRNLPSTTLPSDFKNYDGTDLALNPDDDAYLKAIPYIPGSTQDGQALKWLVELFADLSDFDDSGIQDTGTVAADGASPWSYIQQGLPIRQQFDQMAFLMGAFYWIGPDKVIHYQSFESGENEWGFSDQPDDVTTFGFREVEGVEDGSVIVNDALIWGGGEFAGLGGTVFDREEDATSQTDHGRWQVGEVHFGETGYGIQDGVTARANAIVNGPPGADSYNEQRGLRFPQWQFTFKWLHHRVPALLTPGTIVPINLDIISVSMALPLRSLSIEFPTLDATDGSAYIRFTGEFSLLTSDPFQLWSLLMKGQWKKNHMLLGAVGDTSGGSVFGAYGSFSSAGSGIVMTGTSGQLKFGYVAGTLSIWKDGLILVPESDFTETDNVAGTFEMTDDPGASELYATTRTLSS